MTTKYSRINGVFLSGLLLLMSACGPAEDDLRRYMHEVKTRPPKPIEPIPEFETPQKFKYPENIKRRSPFKPNVVRERQDTQAPNVNRPKQPLEAFPLDALKFVGILKEGSTIWALIRQPGGLISKVRAGDYMGKNYGQIIKITEDSVLLQETMQVGGKWEKKMITLKLRKD